MNAKILGSIVVAVVVTLLLVFFLVPPKISEYEVAPSHTTKPEVAPSVAPPAPAKDERYERDRKAYDELVKLYRAREEKKVEASPAPAEQKEKAKQFLDRVTEAPPPPPPSPNHPKSLDDFEKWEEGFNDEVAQAEKEQGGGLGALIGAVCPVAATAYGAPEAAGLCGLVGPLLEALGISLGEGDDIQKVGQALAALEKDDFGPMKELLQQNPKLAKDLKRFIAAFKEHEAEIRSATVGTSAQDPISICNSVKNDAARSADDRKEHLKRAILAAVSDADKAILQTCLQQQ